MMARRGPWLGGFLTLAAALAVLSMVALVRSMVTMTYLNIRHADEVNPFSRAVSYYVFVEDGQRAFAVSVTVLAAATVAVLVGMAQVGIRLRTPATVFSAAWCTSLTLVALFPTDNGKAIVTTSGMVHQVAGASLFVSLPLAGLSLARGLAEHPAWVRTARIVRRMALIAVGLAAAYLATRLPDAVPGLAVPGVLDGRGISGLVQRALFGLEMLILFALAVRLLRVSVSGARERSQRIEAEAA